MGAHVFQGRVSTALNQGMHWCWGGAERAVAIHPAKQPRAGPITLG